MSDFFLSNLNNSIVQSVFLTALTLRKSVEIKLNFSAFLTNLLKAFGGLSHGLLITKLNSCGFGLEAWRLVQDYLSNRKQRIKVDSTFSSSEEILFRVSILGRLLFIIYLRDLLFVMNNTDFFIYGDVNTPYIIRKYMEDVIQRLKKSKDLFEWFPDNK